MSQMAEANNQERAVNSVLIVGGGTAGWLTAAILASTLSSKTGSADVPKITLIEAPDIPIIGVGEGTWPSMRSTLRRAGIKESDFLKECDASFKQGSMFKGWKSGDVNDYYYHPFDLPHEFFDVNLAQYWNDLKPDLSFSKMACVQEHLCEKDLSPKLRSSREYSGVSNYGYHLNAGKFSEFLKRHCTENLGVRLILDKVTGVVPYGSGECADDIRHVTTENSGNLEADLFIDCSGFRSLLLGQYYGIGLVDKSAEFPIDSALAVQVPYQGEEPIKSATLSTAQEAGWIWDIGLSSRRGVGYVYSSKHTSHSKAAKSLQAYLKLDSGDFDRLEPRSIPIQPGYREKFWHNNCVAIGLSAGFLEPLEASAMMLIETSAAIIAEQFPATRAAMDVVSSRFNKRCDYRWQRIIDFLKLHYVLSERKEPFWRDASSKEHISDRLEEDLTLWQYQAPWKAEFDSLEEPFPSASYQYVLYGMGFNTRAGEAPSLSGSRAAQSVEHDAKLICSKVESNRAILKPS